MKLKIFETITKEIQSAGIAGVPSEMGLDGEMLVCSSAFA